MALNEIRRQWIADLRAGYPQTTNGCLHDARGYCCLGIATEITCGLEPDHVTKDGIHIFDGEPCEAPPSVVEKLGLRGRYGKLAEGSLAGMNDSGDWSFEQIADFIEANPEAVFKD